MLIKDGRSIFLIRRISTQGLPQNENDTIFGILKNSNLVFLCTSVQPTGIHLKRLTPFGQVIWCLIFVWKKNHLNKSFLLKCRWDFAHFHDFLTEMKKKELDKIVCCVCGEWTPRSESNCLFWLWEGLRVQSQNQTELRQHAVCCSPFHTLVCAWRILIFFPRI